jgi:HAMP domain-containing protein
MVERLNGVRGWLALSEALRGLEVGLTVGAPVALLLGLTHWLGVEAATPRIALSAGVVIALGGALYALVRRGATPHRLATLADERLGLAERTATALALRSGTLPVTPLAPLVQEDAERSLAALPPGAVRRAFLPRPRWRHWAGAALALLLALAAFDAEPLLAETERPGDLAAAHREKKEKEEAAKAARRVQEAAREVEEKADPKEAALRALAAEMRRQAEKVLRENPPQAKAMAAFQKMGELSRERQEMLAGVDARTLEEWKAGGKLDRADLDLQKLLGELLAADLEGLNDDLASLDRALKGMEGASPWDADSLGSLQSRLEELADALERNAAALEGREGMRQGLEALGDAELLREIAERMAELMATLQEQGWEGCQSAAGLNPDGMEGFEPGEPVYLTDMELQAMIDRLKELQRMADLGQLAFCQNCGLTGGT